MKRLLIFVIWFLPAFGLAGYFFYTQFNTWFPMAPVWLRPTHLAAMPGACEFDPLVDAYALTFPTDAVDPSLSASARTHAAETFSVPPEDVTILFESAMVEGDFGSGRVPAALFLAYLPEANSGRPVGFVFVDPANGDLLALPVSSGASTPATSCPPAPVSRREQLLAFAPLIAAVGWVIAGGFAFALRRLFGRSKVQ